MKHTPGPWHLGIKQAEQIVYDSKGWAVANATVYHGHTDLDDVKANAHLIAAAPELLTALESLRAELRAHVKFDVKRHYSLMVADVVADKAIAKAKGGADV